MKEHKFGFFVLRLGIGTFMALHGWIFFDALGVAELLTGILLILGLFTLPVLFVGSALSLIALVLQALEGNWTSAGWQLVIIYLFVYLFDTRSQNIFSLDTVRNKKKIGF